MDRVKFQLCLPVSLLLRLIQSMLCMRFENKKKKLSSPSPIPNPSPKSRSQIQVPNPKSKVQMKRNGTGAVDCLYFWWFEHKQYKQIIASIWSWTCLTPWCFFDTERNQRWSQYRQYMLILSSIWSWTCPQPIRGRAVSNERPALCHDAPSDHLPTTCHKDGPRLWSHVVTTAEVLSLCLRNLHLSDPHQPIRGQNNL